LEVVERELEGSMNDAMDLDILVEAAWREFREALADALEALNHRACVQIALDAGEELDGAAPYVRALRVGDSIVLEVASNHVLATAWRLSKRGRRHLRELKLSKPTETAPNYWTTYPTSHVDEAASVAVSALRVAFGVVHPAFLLSDDFAWKTDSNLPTPEGLFAAPAAIYPVDREHLDLLIDQAITPMIGHAPHRDADGDIPFSVGSAVVFVRTQERTPLIRLFAEMVVEISDIEAALHEVDTLNREIDVLKFALHDDKVIATADLLGLPFAAEHLRMLIAHTCEVVSSHDADLARRVGGRVFLDTSENTSLDEVEDDGDEQATEDDIHPVMMCMLQLDAENPGALRPKVAAKLCGYDSDLLLELIRWNEEQEIAWRQARDEAYSTDELKEAEVCESERDHARRTVKVLRKALCRVLLG